MAGQSIFPQLSRGEYRFFVAMLGTCILGGMMAAFAFLRLSGWSASEASVSAMTYWSIITGCVGSVCGLWVCYEKWFGHAGIWGWVAALLGTFVVSGIASVISGTLILPFYGTMFGPFQLIMLVISRPILGVIWLLMMMSAHVLLIEWRRERNSIFTADLGSAS